MQRLHKMAARRIHAVAARRHGGSTLQQQRGGCAVPARWQRRGSTLQQHGGYMAAALAQRPDGVGVAASSGVQASNPKSLTYCSLIVSQWFLSSVDTVPPVFLRSVPHVPHFRTKFPEWGTYRRSSFPLSKIQSSINKASSPNT
jgi:hypothetical protein